jgi:hypothetical protein
MSWPPPFPTGIDSGHLNTNNNNTIHNYNQDNAMHPVYFSHYPPPQQYLPNPFIPPPLHLQHQLMQQQQQQQQQQFMQQQQYQQYLYSQQQEQQQRQEYSRSGAGRARRYPAPNNAQVAPYPTKSISAAAAAVSPVTSTSSAVQWVAPAAAASVVVPPAAAPAAVINDNAAAKAKIPAALLCAIRAAPPSIQAKFNLVVSSADGDQNNDWSLRDDVSDWLEDQDLPAALSSMHSKFPTPSSSNPAARRERQEAALLSAPDLPVLPPASLRAENVELFKKLAHLITTGSLGRCFKLDDEARSRSYFLGYGCLRYHISRMMEMKTAFAMPYLLTQMRGVVLSNDNIAHAHDEMGIDTLLRMIKGQTRKTKGNGIRRRIENITLVLAELEEMANPALDSGMRSLMLNGNGSSDQQVVSARAKDARDGIISFILFLGDELFHIEHPERMARLAQTASSSSTTSKSPT